MIDGVELAAVNQIPHVRDFDDAYAALFQQRPKTASKIVKIWYMRQDIVGMDYVCAVAPLS